MRKLVGFFIWGLITGMSAMYLRDCLYEIPALSQPIVREHGYTTNKNAILAAQKFTVLISHEGFGGGGRGTGVLLDSTHVLTCAHLLPRPDMELWIYPYPGGQIIRAKPVFSNSRKDLAVFELEKPVELKEYARFETKTDQGETITIIGNTLGSMKWFVSYGLVGGYQGIYILTDGLVKPGNSGGPWINNDGAVIAISDWGLRDKNGCDSGVNGGVGSESIVSFLKAWKNPSIMDMLMSGSHGPSKIAKK